MLIDAAREHDPRIPTGLSRGRTNVLELALGEIGTHEQPWGSNRGPVEKYWPGWESNAIERRDEEAGHLVHGPAWCAFFVGWAWVHGLGHHPLDAHVGSVRVMRSRAMTRGMWLGMRGAANMDLVMGPTPGDAFCILHGQTGHTGLILRCSDDCKTWLTVEGNTGNSVKIGRRTVDDPHMAGIVCATPWTGDVSWEHGLGDVEADDTAGLGTR